MVVISKRQGITRNRSICYGNLKLWLCIRVSQYESNFCLFNVFIIIQAHSCAVFIIIHAHLCANFLALRCDKTLQDREPIFAVRFLCPSFQNITWHLTVPLKNILFLNYCTSKIYFKTCKNAQRHKKLRRKNEGQI